MHYERFLEMVEDYNKIEVTLHLDGVKRWDFNEQLKIVNTIKDFFTLNEVSVTFFPSGVFPITFTVYHPSLAIKLLYTFGKVYDCTVTANDRCYTFSADELTEVVGYH